jgi:hypothetical protein
MSSPPPINHVERTACKLCLPVPSFRSAVAHVEPSTDRTAARSVVLRPVGFFEACEARVGKMLLLRQSRQ